MNLLLALFFSILLFLASLFLGKLLYISFKPNILHYLICGFVAFISCVCFTVIFKMNKANNAVKTIQDTVTEYVPSQKYVDIDKTIASLNVEKRINSIRNKIIVVLVIFQLISFIFIGISASKSGKRNAAASFYDDTGAQYY